MSETENQETDYRAKISPAGKLSTMTVKVLSALGFAAGAINTLGGVYQMARGHGTYAAVNFISGGAGILLGVAGWKTATAASNARSFVNEAETQSQLTPRQTENLTELNKQVQEKSKSSGRDK